MTLPEDWPDRNDADGQDEIEIGYRDAADADHFARVQNYVLDHPECGRLEKDAYICLVRYTSWTTRRTKATREKLAAVMSISPDTFDRGIKGLVRLGIVEVLRTRDSQGRWRTSSYILRDTAGARARARIIELEQALEQAKTATQTGATSSSAQAETTPQNAETTEDDKADESATHSAICGVDHSADCGTVHSANCGQYLEGLIGSTREDQFREKSKAEQVLAEGAVTRRTARDAATAPSARKEDLDSEQLARATFSKISDRYRGAPPSICRAMVLTIERALAGGIGPAAVIVYVRRFAADETLPATRHVHHLDQTLTRLRADIKAGDTCSGCGHDPSDSYGPICERCRPDRTELTEQDLADLAAARAHLGEGASA
ncbi:hypothetical protein [Planobispora longispora]|uniref:hypothetical protein n=1 Tax=Planobispora longispora TaxID=28887 RepID=UPI0019436C69|nr:hypothetical protein [Planobispora longispora]BFE85802.1 hypothetical protein GCM10020093_084030 [Planobispora longispora]